MRSVVVLALVFFAFPVAAAGLDGRTFHGEILDEKGIVRSKDVVTFADGKFHSATCERLGFGAAPYWMRVEGDALHFFVETAHPDNGTMLFSGVVRGAAAEWSAIWTKKRWYWSIRREVTFRGAEQK